MALFFHLSQNIAFFFPDNFSLLKVLIWLRNYANASNLYSNGDKDASLGFPEEFAKISYKNQVFCDEGGGFCQKMSFFSQDFEPPAFFLPLFFALRNTNRLKKKAKKRLIRSPAGHFLLSYVASKLPGASRWLFRKSSFSGMGFGVV